MIELKVRKFGNSLGVILPREAIERMRSADGAALFLIEAPDGGYLMSPYDPAFADKMRKADDIAGRYRNALRSLDK